MNLINALCGRAGRSMAALAVGLLLACAARGQQLPLRHFGQLDGLDNLAVSALVQDRAGYLWVGTENGLYRFDGARFQRHPLGGGNDTFISALHVDPAGRLWMGTDRGLFLLGEGGLLEVRDGDGEALPVKLGQHLASADAHRLLVQSNGRLYRVQSDGNGRHAVRAFTAAQISERPELADLNGILLESDGTLWLGCKLSLCRYRAGAVSVLDAADGLPARRWHGLLRDRDGALWLSGGNRLMRLAPHAQRFSDRSPQRFGLVENGPVTPLLQDADGRLLSLSDNGLFRDGEGGWRRYGEANGLRTGVGSHALLFDRDGDLWIGLPGRGLVQWQGYRHWENWTRAQGLPDDDVWSLLRTGDGVLHVATGRGLASLRGDRFAAAPTGPARSQPWSALAEDAHGDLWAASFSRELLRRDRRTGRYRVVARLPDRITNRLLFDAAGRLWICTDGGLYLIADPRTAPVPLPVGPARALLDIEGKFLDACRDAGGRLWFAGTHGLLRLDGERWSRPPLQDNGPGFSQVVCDGDTLWLAQYGSARLWRADATRAQPRLLALGHALLEGRVLQSMAVDQRHWLWLGTDIGLMVWNGQRWRLLNEQSGMVWNDTNQGAIHADRDGSIWIGTSNGVSRVLRPELLFAPRTVPLRLESARYGGAALAGGAAPWSGAALEVRLAAPLFQNHEALRYRYRLLGQEEAWAASVNGELRYAALAPGEYRLQVVAEHATSQASSAMLELPLTIAPRWWQTRWAYAGGVSLMLAAFGALHRYRVGQVLRQRALLERRVAERTAELEASREEHRLRSLKDGLTQAWNRTALMERLAALTAPGAGPFLLVLLDLDHFKKVNDTHGHLAGDEVLREMVRRVQAQLRASDTVGRYGGEEFMLLLPGLDLAGGARRLARLHREVCAAPVEIDRFGPLPVTCSGGVVICRPRLELSAEHWIALADAALYRAKALGRNRLEYAADAAGGCVNTAPE